MIYDVLVIGSGVAGLSAALEARAKGSRVAVVCKSLPLRSNSSMACGGINAVLATMEVDHVSNHIGDTIESGKGLSLPGVVRVMCERAPDAIYKLHKLGVPFALSAPEKIAQRSFGGSGKKRTCYIGDKTGAALVQQLFKQCRETGVTFLPNHFVMNLIHTKGRISGVTLLRKNDAHVLAIAAKAVVLASGGFAGIYQGHTTNPIDTNGDMIAAALRAGLWAKDLELVQFHPTGLAKNGALLSEAARGEGGYLVNTKGARFVDELSTRDVVTRAIMKEMEKGEAVFLDVTHLGEAVIDEKLPGLKQTCWLSQNIDVTKERIPITPVAHYTMGGIEVDANAQTTIRGLYACGEVACSGVHGANRLGGNSLIEGVVFGEIAGHNAANFATKHTFLPIDYETVAREFGKVEYIFKGENLYNVAALRKQLGKTMFENVGIYREEQRLVAAFEYIKYLRKLMPRLHCIDKSKDNNVEIVAILELINALQVAEAVVFCALHRKTSIGSHERLDAPKGGSKPSHTILKVLRGGFLKIERERTGVFWQAKRWLMRHFTN
jgi:succinate dehydrogenase/fumarate reductase flavoprotein subunit